MTQAQVDTVRNALADIAISLDIEDFEGFLDRCTEDFRYEVIAHSPDLGTEMRWLEHDAKELREVFAMIPKHVTMRGKILRHVSLARIVENEVGASATSSVLIAHTTETGESRLIACGRYHDEFVFDEAGSALLAARQVALDTVMWSPGLHVPV